MELLFTPLPLALRCRSQLKSGTRRRRMEARSEDRRNPHPIAKPDISRGFDAASSARARALSSCGSPERSLQGSGCNSSVEPDFVRAVLDYYLWLPGTATVVSRHDQACARALFRRGVPLEVVKGAMVVAVTRRTFRRGDPLPRVRALHFFLPVID